MSKAPRPKTTTHKLQDLLEETGMTAAEVAPCLGMSPTAIREYARDGEMPVTVSLACEALLSREREDKTKPRVAVLYGPAAEVERLADVVEHFATTVNITVLD